VKVTHVSDPHLPTSAYPLISVPSAVIMTIVKKVCLIVLNVYFKSKKYILKNY